MEALFPTFCHSLQSLQLCSCFPLADSAFSARLEGQKKKVEADFDSEAGRAWIHLELDRFHKREGRPSGRSPAGFEGHFHIECGLYSSSKGHRHPSENRDEVSELLKLFAAQKTGKVCAEGVFRTNKDAIPKEGVADLMLRISTKVGGATLTLTEAGFNVSGRPPYEKLAWRLKPGAEDPNDLDIRIVVYSDLEQATADLEALCQLMWDGVEEMIFESGSNSTA
jgi:hypothetical protein